MRFEPVSRDFFELPTLELARKLLGTILVHEHSEGTAAGMIVEAEAYIGPWDKAAHSYSNRRTARTEAMFGPAGHAYIFTIYGMHNCFNVVSGPIGQPEAVLIRALEPVYGLEVMQRRRGKQRTKLLTNGPGKLTQALAITRRHYGWDLTVPPLYLAAGCQIPAEQITCGKRIGIDYAEEAADFPWRFWVKGNRFVSK